MDETPPQRKRTGKKRRRRPAWKWALLVFTISFLITAVLSLVSGEMITALPIWAAILVLLLFITLGIVFDVIGLAVATADISVFNSMAAQKLRMGKKAVWLIANAEKVSSFCNDVVGDIAGVVSGATGAAIAAVLFLNTPGSFWFTLMVTSFIAAFTVGGKALGKQVAIQRSSQIVLLTARVLCGFKK